MLRTCVFQHELLQDSLEIVALFRVYIEGGMRLPCRCHALARTMLSESAAAAVANTTNTPSTHRSIIYRLREGLTSASKLFEVLESDPNKNPLRFATDRAD